MIKINWLKSIFLSKIDKFRNIRLQREFKICNALFLEILKFNYPELRLNKG